MDISKQNLNEMVITKIEKKPITEEGLLKQIRLDAIKINKEIIKDFAKQFAKDNEKELSEVIKQIEEAREPNFKKEEHTPYIKRFFYFFNRLPTEEELLEFIKLFVMTTKEDYEIIKRLPSNE